VWNQGFFNLSSTTLEDLEDESHAFDFAILVLGSDDLAFKRKTIKPAVRDNVLFELGFFIGRVGRKRTFMFRPSKLDMHLPSDLLGHNAAEYDAARSDNNWDAAVGPGCNAVRKAIEKLGPRT
jgi:predicted nucleotide-binding protein